MLVWSRVVDYFYLGVTRPLIILNETMKDPVHFMEWRMFLSITHATVTFNFTSNKKVPFNYTCDENLLYTSFEVLTKQIREVGLIS